MEFLLLFFQQLFHLWCFLKMGEGFCVVLGFFLMNTVVFPYREGHN